MLPPQNGQILTCDTMITSAVLHVLFIAQTEALHRLSNFILMDRDVNTVIFGQEWTFPSKDYGKRTQIICNIIQCVLTCEFWILFLFLDVSNFYVSTQLFMALRYTKHLQHTEIAILIVGTLLWFVVQSPHCVNLVYYQIFTTPATAYEFVESYISNIRHNPIRSIDVHFLCWIAFWGYSVISFSRNVHWFDIGLLPITFYLDVDMWKKRMKLLSTV